VSCVVSLKITARAINNPALKIETNEFLHKEVESNECEQTDVERIHVTLGGKE